ncbi:hypothetical protein QQX98_007753 [Neonectria punicea]|uniref:DNA2/NAM7 helicase-like C-terminal domain-containing protein n=1 Tax=Neonectria punicea TaxID=979145 RepID=A0ABR1GX47_9HYPO
MAGIKSVCGIQPRLSIKAVLYPCALVTDDLAKPGLGKAVYADSLAGLSLFKHAPANSSGHLGIRLAFPRDNDTTDSAWYSASLSLEATQSFVIVCKLPRDGITISHKAVSEAQFNQLKLHLPPETENTFRMVTVQVHNEHAMTVQGFGLPFRGRTPEVDSWINHDKPINGVVKLTSLLLQREFTFLVKAEESQLDSLFDMSTMNCTPFSYGFGDEHTWNLERYTETIPRNRGLCFEPRIRYDDSNQRNTCLTQMHVQDVWDFDAALKEMAKIPDHQHWSAARRALKGDRSLIRVSIHSPDNREEPVTWEAIHLTYGSPHLRGLNLRKYIPVALIRPNHDRGGEDCDFSPIASDNHKEAEAVPEDLRHRLALVCYSGLEGEKRRVNAVNRLDASETWPEVMRDDPLAVFKKSLFNDLINGQGLWGLFTQGTFSDSLSLPLLPKFDLFSGVSPKVLDACLELVYEDDRARFQKYFANLHLGLGLISSPPGTGKSHMASVIVTLLCLNENIRQVLVSAPSNVATDNILDRVGTISTETIDKLIATSVPTKQLMLLRGYNQRHEMDNCMDILGGKTIDEDDGWSTSPWRFKRSLCWWTLRVLGSTAVPALSRNDCTALWSLHRKLIKLLPTRGNGNTDKSEPEDPEEDDTTNHTKMRDLTKFSRLVGLANETMTLDQYRRGSSRLAQKEILTNLMGLVVSCANVVATTPATSNVEPYVSFNSQTARAVVFDEAGAMFRADGLLVFGNTPRPMIAVGDEKQLAPLLVTALQKLGPDSNNSLYSGSHQWSISSLPINRFAGDAPISWLTWFMHLGWPVFHLYTQHRMADGMFDLSLNAVYYELKAHIKYAPSCLPVNFPVGMKVEKYLTSKHRLPSSAPDKLLPIFFNCVNCPCRNYPQSASRFNPRQADCIAKCLSDMIQTIGLSPSDVVVLTPYRANLRSIQKRFKEDDVLKDIVAATIDSFQGREAEVIVLALCVTKKTGPSLVADPRRLNVSLTRQRSSLLIFGDINTPSEFDSLIVVENEDGSKARLRAAMLVKVLRTLQASRRVVKLKGDPEIDPDAYWSHFEASLKFMG